MSDNPTVYLTRELPPKAMEALKEGSQLDYNQDDRVLSRDEVIEGMKGKNALLCLLTDKIDGELMDTNPGLQVISNYAVGYNNIDVDAATQRKIPVTNTPGVLTDTTADMAWALMFAASRRVAEGDRLARSGTWAGWAPLQLLGVDITGAVLGIVGLGRIGRAVARRAKGFGMTVIYADEQPCDAETEKELGVVRKPLEDVLREADFVSVHVPLSEATTHLIGAEQFNAMKPSAVLVNTSRGPIIDEKALVEALRAGQIGCAGLDVYEEEPALAPGLAEIENVVLAPHLGSATIGTRTRMGMMAAENLLAVCRGERPAHIVNPEVLG